MTARHTAARPLSWATAALVTGATACGIWFGVSAPEVSPVAPTAVAAVQTAPAPTDRDTGNDRADGPGARGDGGNGNGGRRGGGGR